MDESILNTIKKFNLINKGDRIVIGVSGGPDSITLLNVLNNLKNVLGCKLYVAHVNHQIREEAEAETEYVIDFCNRLGIECFVKRVDVIAKSAEEKIGTEEAGRKARYDFFDEVFYKVEANKIVTAHNANDNAETVLMNIFRGTGTSGLKGIEPIRDNKYIRPLIECERKDIEEYCNRLNLQPKIDKSNFENVYTRNKIRNILIPKIKEMFNPNIIEALNKLSNVAREENDYLQNESNKILNNDLSFSYNKEDKMLIIDLKKFNKLDIVIRKRIILLSIEKVMGSTQGIEKTHIDDIIKLCQNNIGNKFIMPNKNLKISVGKGKIEIFNVTNL